MQQMERDALLRTVEAHKALIARQPPPREPIDEIEQVTAAWRKENGE